MLPLFSLTHCVHLCVSGQTKNQWGGGGPLEGNLAFARQFNYKKHGKNWGCPYFFFKWKSRLRQHLINQSDGQGKLLIYFMRISYFFNMVWIKKRPSNGCSNSESDICLHQTILGLLAGQAETIQNGEITTWINSWPSLYHTKMGKEKICHQPYLFINPFTHGLFEVHYLTACGLNCPQICGRICPQPWEMSCSKRNDGGGRVPPGVGGKLL